MNVQRALKLIPPHKVLNPQNFFHEAQILKAVEHPNIVRVEETGTMKDGRIYVAMEYLANGSLEDEAKGAYVPLTRAKRLIVDVLRGLQHAHEQGVIHRDIKSANILIGDRKEGKLSDFGLAVPVGIDLDALGIKDYNYVLHQAPEVRRPGDYSVSTDIYACAMTLYRLVNGDSILPSLPLGHARSLATQGKFPDRSAYRNFIPRPLKTVINKGLNPEPSKRFRSAEDMRHAIEQVTIEKNWTEKTMQDGMEWTCGWNNRCYEIIKRRKSDRTWDVIVRKGRTKKSLRKMSELCLENSTKAQADQHSRRVLQDFVLGRQA